MMWRLERPDPRTLRGVFRLCPACRNRVMPAWEQRCRACASVVPSRPVGRVSREPPSRPSPSDADTVPHPHRSAALTAPVRRAPPDDDATTEPASTLPGGRGRTVIFDPRAVVAAADVPASDAFGLVFDARTAAVAPRWQLLGIDVHGRRMRAVLAWSDGRWQLLDPHGAPLPAGALEAFGLRRTSR